MITLIQEKPVKIPSTHLSLLCAMNNGDWREDAWAVFVARYREVILVWCRRRGLPPDWAEDLFQDVLIKLLQALSRSGYDASQGPFYNWLKAIVGNAVTDCWRRQQRRPQPEGVGGSAFLGKLQNLPGPGAEEEFSGALEPHAQLAAAVIEQVRAKHPKTWEAFYRTTFEGCPPARVAAELGLKVGTVRKAKARIKKALAEEIKHVQAAHGPFPELSRRDNSPEVPG
jgi:RNA polymerase sigma factor (sigma-70 family)